ncbi:factor of DNA methylation 1-like isoform X1 [Gossypium australe]|uniref:Factor of DNA methylation 1-like isoform X1 n=1 Tax=Gossypium australe TaxID=47621 RepID=A0A5B6UMN8_9ROSI|nr:factor of DNA methylation 1-like isoform X1 [Gossypium australe]
MGCFSSKLLSILGQDDAAVQKKMEEMNNELQEKIDDLQDLESTNKALKYKECQSNDKQHEARKVLIQGLPELLGNRTNIGLKRMGELDPKAFHDTWKVSLKVMFFSDVCEESAAKGHVL